jgi:CRP-like cAMP-binding protein
MPAPETLARQLRALPVFALLSDEDAEELSRGCFVLELSHGDLLFAEGQAPDHLYVLLAGEAQVSCLTTGTDEVVVGRAHPGAVLGEMALFDRSLRSASVRAQGATRVLQIPGARFGDLVQDAHPAAWTLLRAIREQLVERLRGVAERVDAALEPPHRERDSEALRTTLNELQSSTRGGLQ